MRRSDSIAEQAAKPSGVLGWIIGVVMSQETRSDNHKAIAMLDVKAGDFVADIGTGHGRSLATLCRKAINGKVYGIDTSEVMLGIAKRSNRRQLKQGQLELINASCLNLPLKDRSMDRVMAVHTLYFWSPAEDYVREIARVIKPGGHLVLAFRPEEDEAVVRKFPATVYHFRSIIEVKTIFVRADFVEVELVHHDIPGKSVVWLHMVKQA